MEAIMASSTTRLALGAIALGMAIAGLSATGTPLNVAQTLVNLDEVSETDAQLRQQLRRHFIQERRDLRERLPSL